MIYRPEIDGLRAIAVLPVVFFHAGYEYFSGGFVGVDVFFVISGYLITSIILTELQKESFNLLTFYERRARRLLPALFFVVSACIPAAWLVMLPSEMKDFSQSLVAISIFSSNILFYLESSSYFSPSVELKPLLHTWSLAVEEQFYILFPLFLMIFHKKSRSTLLIALLMLIAVSFTYGLFEYSREPMSAFYLAHTRAWELISGSLCAVFLNLRRQTGSNFLSILGLFMILVSVGFLDSTTPFPSPFTLLPVFGTMLVILYSSEETLIGKLLSNSALVAIGLASYSIYLWHQPLLAFARLVEFDSEKVAIPVILTSLLLGFFTRRFIEKPFRDRSIVSKKAVFQLSIIGCGLFAFFGAIGHITNGFSNRFDLPKEVSDGFRLPSYTSGYCFDNLDIDLFVTVRNELPCKLTDHIGDRKALIFGDSFAGHWDPLFRELSDDFSLDISSVSSSWCFPSMRDEFLSGSSTDSIRHCRTNREWLRTHYTGFDTIILAGAWHLVVEDGFEGGVFDLVDFLRGSGRKVVLIDIPPQFKGANVERALFFNSAKLTPNEHFNQQGSVFWDLASSRFDDLTGIELLSFDQLKNDGWANFYSNDGFPLTFDGGHLSIYGALQIYNSPGIKDKMLAVISP